MSIPLIDRIVPKNNGAFPVFNATDGYGSFQVRTDHNDRDSIPQLNRKSGMISYTISDGYYWQLGPSLQNTDWQHASFSAGSSVAVDLNIAGQVSGSTIYFNGINWVSLAPGPDGYFLTTHASGPPTWTPPPNVIYNAIAYVPNWYVDASAGNDNNDGKTSGTAFKTIEKLCSTLCPNGARFVPQQNVAIYVAAGSYGELFIRGYTPLYFVQIFCAYTSSAPITLSAVINTNSVTNTRGQITTTGSLGFTANARIRAVTDGYAGAITYSTGQNASTKNHFVKEWFLYNDLVAEVVTISNGTNVVIDTLAVSFSRVDIDFDGAGAVVQGYIELWDAKVFNDLNLQLHSEGGNTNLVGCEFNTNSGRNIGYVYGQGAWWNCNIKSSIGFSEQFPAIEGCIFQTGVNCITYPTTNLGIFAGNCFNGATLSSIENNGAVFIENDIEFCNGGSNPAININAGASIIVQTGKLWGASTNYSVGVRIASFGQMCTPSNTTISIPATVQVQMTGKSFNYSDMPKVFPQAGCIWSINPDTSATANLNIPGQAQGDTLYFNGTNWVKLAAGNDGYFLQTHSGGPVWSPINITTTNNWSIPNWYLNQTSGSDANDGLTSGTALKTIEEFSNRLSPNGEVAFLKQTTTLNITAGTYGKPYLNIGSGSLIINSAISSTANILTNSVTNTNAANLIRGEIETASGIFIDQRRVRVTSGSQIGAIAFCTGLNGDSSKAFISSFISNSGSQVNISNGDNVVVDTLGVTFNSSSLLTTINSSIIVNGAIFSNGCYSSNGVTFNECHFSNGAILLGGGVLQFCSLNSVSIGNGVYNGFGNQILGICNTYYTQINLLASNVFDDCNTFIGKNVNLNIVDIELVRRTQSIGLIFPSGSKIISTGYLWSGTGAYSNTAIQMDPGSYFSFKILPIISANNNIYLAGIPFNWNQLPQKVGSTEAEYNEIFNTENDGYVSSSLITFHGNAINPIINQNSRNIASLDAQSLTIQAQNTTGLNSRGGDLIFQSGTGVPNDSSINASDGYLVFKRGNQTVASWLTGQRGNGGIGFVDDFIAFGATPAGIGNIRFSGGPNIVSPNVGVGSIYGRDMANDTDIPLLNWTGDQLYLGGGFNRANLVGSDVFIWSTIGSIQLIMAGIYAGGFSSANGLQIGSTAMPANIGSIGTIDVSKNVQDLTILGGNATGANTIGGGIVLQSGSGIPNVSGVNASDGYITVKRNNQTVAYWGSGHRTFNETSLVDDFIAFGNNPPSFGTIRFSGGHDPIGSLIGVTSSIAGRTADGLSDVQLLGWVEDILVLGNELMGVRIGGSQLSLDAIDRIDLSFGQVFSGGYSKENGWIIGTNYFDLSGSPATYGAQGDNQYSNHVGQTLTFLGAQSNGPNSRGGPILIKSGFGNPNVSGVNAEDGYITLQQGNASTPSAFWGGGFDSFVNLGSDLNPASMTGSIRLPRNGTIKFRNSANSDDVIGLGLDASNNLILTGNISSTAGTGSITPPITIAGYLPVTINGTSYKISLFNP